MLSDTFKAGCSLRALSMTGKWGQLASPARGIIKIMVKSTVRGSVGPHQVAVIHGARLIHGPQQRIIGRKRRMLPSLRSKRRNQLVPDSRTHSGQAIHISDSRCATREGAARKRDRRRCPLRGCCGQEVLPIHWQLTHGDIARFAPPSSAHAGARPSVSVAHGHRGRMR